jgi:HK97 gp10 family phage protein
MAEFKIEGLAELDRALKTLPTKIAGKVRRSANASGAGIIRKEARVNLVQRIKTVDDGTAETLKGIVSRKTDEKPHTVEHSIGATTREFNVNFIETGSAPHTISTNNPAGLGSGGLFFGPSVQHPGQSAKPWLRPAFDGNKQKVIDKIGERLWAGIKRETAKLQ